MPIGADYTIKKGQEMILYKVSFGEYTAWLENNRNYKVSRVAESTTSFMVHYTVYVREVK